MEKILLALGIGLVLLVVTRDNTAEIIPSQEPLKIKLPRSMGGDYSDGDTNDE